MAALQISYSRTASLGGLALVYIFQKERVVLASCVLPSKRREPVYLVRLLN